MKTSIALIGFMGAGKTVAGEILAKILGKEFIEMDTLVEKKAGKSVPEIFLDVGEIGFRELEIEVTREVAGRKNAVIACGGGIVLNKINIDRLGKECVIICLTATPSEIFKRVSVYKNERPMLAVEDRAGRINELLKFRRPYYKQSADIMVNTSRLTPEAVARRIIEKLREYESQHR
jgi:shikimate kinase